MPDVLTEFRPLQNVWERCARAREDSDVAYFHELLLLGELALKLTVGAAVTIIDDDRDRHRYRLVHKLVRASGIGDWESVLEDALTGPASQYLCSSCSDLTRALTMRHGPGTDTHSTCSLLWEALDAVGADLEPMPTKVSLRTWVQSFVHLRNKTRGHGATSRTAQSDAARHLEASVRGFIASNPVFTLEWAVVRQNLSGKCNVAALTPSLNGLDTLKRKQDHRVQEGVYVYVGGPRRVEIAHSDVDTRDFYVFNGGYNQKRFELLSYATGDRLFDSTGRYATPAETLPESATGGLKEFTVRGSTFTNAPTNPDDYIPRPDLEKELLRVLQSDRHEIVTLHGRGGIGKTSLAIHVLDLLCAADRFELIAWFSARDIDLLPSGPKQVRPQFLTRENIAADYARWLAADCVHAKPRDQVEYFAAELGKASEGTTLFVFDNFETVPDTDELFAWIDNYIRPPNKILITTRHRDFRGDYPVEVGGMTQEESFELMKSTGARLDVLSLLSSDYQARLHEDSDGHPYVIKMLLSETARQERRINLRELASGNEHVLTALFERTYGKLSPAAKRVFLTLASWNSSVPELALKAVLLRPANESIPVGDAVDELLKASLIEQRRSDADRQVFLKVPLAAALFGREKLAVDALNPIVTEDRRYLMAFGAAQDADIKAGVGPRLQRLTSHILDEATQDSSRFAEYESILREIASNAPEYWFDLANLYEEIRPLEWEQKAEEAARSFVAKASYANDEEHSRAWRKIAYLAGLRDDVQAQVHAFVEMATARGSSIEIVSHATNQVNGLLQRDGQRLEFEAKRELVARLASVFQGLIDEADATDLSRLAWLNVHLRNHTRVRELAARGLKLEPSNEHCLNLQARFEKK